MYKYIAGNPCLLTGSQSLWILLPKNIPCCHFTLQTPLTLLHDDSSVRIVPSRCRNLFHNYKVFWPSEEITGPCTEEIVSIDANIT